MYKLEFLPIAKKDIEDIVQYISHNLKNPIAAKKLSNNFIVATNSILEFPYGYPIYNLFENLKNEYRSIKVKNFLMFYTIDEEKKTITIARILYQKMSIDVFL